MKNAKFIILIGVCIVAIASTLFFYSSYEEKKSSYERMSIEFIKIEEIETDTALDAVSFIKSTKNVTDIEYPTIKTNTIGEHVFVYIAIDAKGNRKEFPLLLNFVDPTIPILELSASQVEIEDGDKIDLYTYVAKAEDEKDGQLKVAIKKPKNFLIGENKVTYSVTDNSGNKISKDLFVIVREKKKEDVSVTDTNPSQEVTPVTPTNPVTPVDPITPIPNTPSNPVRSQNKSFIFGDKDPVTGEEYNVRNVPTFCANYLFSFKANGRCENIIGDNGYAIGQQAIFE